MTGILLVTIVIALLIAALAPAHRRARTPYRPGADLREDRDHQRLTAELEAVAQRRTRTAARVVGFLGAAGSAVAIHRRAPRVTTR